LRYSIRLLIWDLSVLLIYALMAINFSLRTAFAVSHRFWYVVFSFSLTSRKLLISLLFHQWSIDHWAMCVQFPIVCMFFSAVFVVEF
jgi:hypothetical protein